MIKILINSYTCCPNMGSEQGMGWNWIVSLARHCELYVISEGEYRNQCEEASKDLPIHWYWNPVSPKVRKMCWNQGDWRFYKYYRHWQYKTYEMAREIIATTHIDVMHQLNMIGFREPGYLWKIDDVPLVWGPIGGLKQFPMAYADGGGGKMRLFNRLKNVINILQLKYDRRVKAALLRSALLASSIPDSYKAIKKYHNLESVVIPETGCFDNMQDVIDNRDFYSKYMQILWVGKFDFRKRLDIALRTIATVCNSLIVFKVFGTGNERQVKEAEELCAKLGIEDWGKIEWMGNCPNETIQQAMREAHLFFFTSVSEDTSTVVMESISNRLPVLCFDTCGMGYVVNDNVGIKIPLSTPVQSVNDFAEKIEYLYRNRDVLKRMSDNCAERGRELSWDSKAQKMVELYKSINH